MKNKLLKVSYSMELQDQVREVIRKKHYSIRTKQAYVDWTRRSLKIAVGRR